MAICERFWKNNRTHTNKWYCSGTFLQWYSINWDDKFQQRWNYDWLSINPQSFPRGPWPTTLTKYSSKSGTKRIEKCVERNIESNWRKCFEGISWKCERWLPKLRKQSPRPPPPFGAFLKVKFEHASLFTFWEKTALTWPNILIYLQYISFPPFVIMLVAFVRFPQLCISVSFFKKSKNYDKNSSLGNLKELSRWKDTDAHFMSWSVSHHFWWF